jgi:hypothetical protein
MVTIVWTCRENGADKGRMYNFGREVSWEASARNIGKEVGSGDGKWIELAQDRVQWRGLV